MKEKKVAAKYGGSNRRKRVKGAKEAVPLRNPTVASSFVKKRPSMSEVERTSSA